MRLEVQKVVATAGNLVHHFICSGICTFKSVIQMHRGASLFKAGKEQGKGVLKEARANLESPQIASLVSPVNLKRIASMKELL